MTCVRLDGSIVDSLFLPRSLLSIIFVFSLPPPSLFSLSPSFPRVSSRSACTPRSPTRRARVCIAVRSLTRGGSGSRAPMKRRRPLLLPIVKWIAMMTPLALLLVPTQVLVPMPVSMPVPTQVSVPAARLPPAPQQHPQQQPPPPPTDPCSTSSALTAPSCRRSSARRRRPRGPACRTQSGALWAAGRFITCIFYRRCLHCFGPVRP
jgi:hypothetical protein